MFIREVMWSWLNGGWILGGNWIQVSEKILNQLKKLEEVEQKDRLELVRSMRYALGALEMSLTGWKGWVNNPDVMTRFTPAELGEMNEKLFEFARSFVKYDIEATKLGVQKGLKARKKVEKKGAKRKVSYVA
jgi:hypothetical protein